MSKWENRKWEDILTIINGKSQAKVVNEKGQYPIYGSGGIMGYADDYICNENTVIIGRKGSINKPIFVETKFWNVDTAFGLQANKDLLIPKYLYYFCIKFNFEKLNTTVTIPSLTKRNLLNIIMPVPPLDSQKHIAETLDKVSEIINLHKKRLEELDNLIKSTFYDMFGDPFEKTSTTKMICLSEICEIIMGQSPKGDSYNSEGIGTPLLNGPSEFGDRSPCEKQWTDRPTKMCESNDILFCVRGATAGRMNIADKEYCIGRGLAAVRPKNENIREFIFLYLEIMYDYFQKTSNGSTFINIGKEQLTQLPIVMPNKEFQTKFAKIVTKIEEQKILEKQAISESENLFNSLMSKYFD